MCLFITEKMFEYKVCWFIFKCCAGVWSERLWGRTDVASLLLNQNIPWCNRVISVFIRSLNVSGASRQVLRGVQIKRGTACNVSSVHKQKCVRSGLTCCSHSCSRVARYGHLAGSGNLLQIVVLAEGNVSQSTTLEQKYLNNYRMDSHKSGSVLHVPPQDEL